MIVFCDKKCDKNDNKLIPTSHKALVLVVGATGFEPAASWSRTKRATKLRYAPTQI